MKPSKPANEIERLVRAFGYSWAGLKVALKHPAFRIEALAAIVMIPLACVLTPSGAERALLIGSIMLVLIVELLNTGIEITIDRISADYHELSKRAKDIGSAAVLVSLANAGLVWLFIVWGG